MLTRSLFANIQSNCSIYSHGYPQNMGTVGRLVERATAPANGLESWHACSVPSAELRIRHPRPVVGEGKRDQTKERES